MRVKIKVFMIAFAAVVLAGCYVRYPSIGVSSKHTIRPTNWRGQVCVLTLDTDTGTKVYVCGPDRFRRP